jgi:hypothetical protein
MRSLDTTSFAFVSSSASSVRWIGEPIRLVTPSRTTSTGPSTRNSSTPLTTLTGSPVDNSTTQSCATSAQRAARQTRFQAVETAE